VLDSDEQEVLIMETRVEIRLEKDNFELKKKDYLAACIAEDPNIDKEDYEYLINPNMLEIDEIEYKEGSIVLSASMHTGGERIGYVYCDIPLDSEILTSILETQIKKYNKIKTIIEATK
jgi:hypothetical protein